MRDLGYSADLDFAGRSVKAQFKAANRRQARFVITLGDEEVQTGQVKVKDMQTGNQADLNLGQLDLDLPAVIEALVAEEEK
ncbi:histidine--tRNA ligase [Fructobacillus ficulneus]|uniref:Histidine--tRNA ligase n=1 Tax=Fructobacillus ficulneus TaxID=157463 RepID=A0A0K8MK31_9LACO|nr:histidine--tRNA ligase [Fructobacillus ficulneus]